MSDLRELLTDHNWYTLRAIAYAHTESFDARLTKDEAVEYVARLIDDRRMVAVLESATAQTQEALQTLLACNGEMRAHRFLDHFGPVRPYRPWREGSPSAPWRNPVSPAERLWFLGLIYFRSDEEGRVVVIPPELVDLLPTLTPPPRAQPAVFRSSLPDPILDLGHLLTYLQGHDVKPLSGRWLTVRHLRTLNLGLAHPDPAVATARSELQTGSVRFLHYLAETANLVGPVGGLLKPRSAAWRWLDLPEAGRWRVVWQSWLGDLKPDPEQESLWNRYRLPGPPTFVLTFFDTLRLLASHGALHGHAIKLAALSDHVRRRSIGAGTLPRESDVVDTLKALVSGPLTWSHVLRGDSAGHITLAAEGAWLLDPTRDAPAAPPVEPAVIRTGKDRVSVTLPEPPSRPPIRPLVALGLPAKDRRTRHLSRERFVALLAHGVERARIAHDLSALTCAALPSGVLNCLEAWEGQARGLTVRRLTVLSVADAQLVEALTKRRSIRDLILETLSPHDVVVDPQRVDKLVGALRRCGHTPLVQAGSLSRSRSDTDPADAGAAAYLWLALQTYLHLADLIQLPVVPPAALLDQLEHLIDKDELAELASLARTARERLDDVVDGYGAFPAPLPGVDHVAIQDTIEQALEEACPILIVYHTAGRGERTERVVEPLRLEEHGGARYLIAYCRLRQDERVFRVDRIESAVLQDKR